MFLSCVYALKCSPHRVLSCRLKKMYSTSRSHEYVCMCVFYIKCASLWFRVKRDYDCIIIAVIVLFLSCCIFSNSSSNSNWWSVAFLLLTMYETHHDHIRGWQNVKIYQAEIVKERLGIGMSIKMKNHFHTWIDALLIPDLKLSESLWDVLEETL